MAIQHKIKGIVNYTVVGSPAIVNGVLVGGDVETASNYLQLTQALNLNNDFEIQYKFKLNGASTVSYPFAIQATSTNYGNFVYNPGLNPKRVQFLLWPKTTGGWETLESGSYGFDENTDYWLRVIKTDNHYEMLVSTDGTAFVTVNEKTYSDLPTNIPTSNTVQVGRSSTAGRYLLGSIDLNQTYFKVNGQPWFGVCPVEVQKHQFRGPVGWSAEGNSIVTDGIIESVSSGNYVRIGAGSEGFFNPGEYDFEMVFKAKSTQYYSLFAFGADDLKTRIVIGANTGEAAYWVVNSSVDTSATVRLPGSVLDGNWKYFKASRTRGTTKKYTYSLAYSTDKTNWISESIESDLEVPTAASRPFLLSASSRVSNGPARIDLNSTYIKVNGKLWFWQPQETKKIVLNNTLVWEKPS